MRDLTIDRVVGSDTAVNSGIGGLEGLYSEYPASDVGARGKVRGIVEQPSHYRRSICRLAAQYRRRVERHLTALRVDCEREECPYKSGGLRSGSGRVGCGGGGGGGGGGPGGTERGS